MIQRFEEQMATSTPELDLSLLGNGMEKLPPEVGAFIALAAAVCFVEEDHLPGVLISIQTHNDEELTYAVRFEKPSSDQLDSLADPDEATEWGAIGIAILTVREVTGLTSVKRSVKGTGFDWWLGEAADPLFQNAARLEVSGIRHGTESDIKTRLRKKLKQTARSDDSGLPAYATVVEFSQPTVRIATR